MPATVHIALGSNRRHGRHGAPARVVAAAIVAIGLPVVALSRTRTTKPLGPGGRAFANAVVAVATRLPLGVLLRRLQAIEAGFGRRGGRRWGARVLDLDIVAAGAQVIPARGWRHARRGLVVPHRGVAGRDFVLDPLAEVAPGWRHPVLHLTARQLRARQRRPKPRLATSP